MVCSTTWSSSSSPNPFAIRLTMTGPLSSPRESTQPRAYVDARGQRVTLGAQVGAGGEGAIFAVEGQPALAAKIYHKSPLAADHAEKISAMVDRRTDALSAVSAWPQ